MDIAAWLRGLEQYEPAFRANEIDEEVLASLTSEDLREIGVVLIGHRRRLLNAIAALGTEAPIVIETIVSREAPAPANAERRQLTVMFCDLVRLRSPRGWIPRICARSSPRITAPSPKSSPDPVASSPGIWATAFWFISATRKRMRTTPSGRYGLG